MIIVIAFLIQLIRVAKERVSWRSCLCASYGFHGRACKGERSNAP